MLNLRGTAPDLDPTDRGDDGDGGIIRSPIRAIVLPDRTSNQICAFPTNEQKRFTNP